MILIRATRAATARRLAPAFSAAAAASGAASSRAASSLASARLARLAPPPPRRAAAAASSAAAAAAAPLSGGGGGGGDDESVRLAILDAALGFVGEEGWSAEALAAGAQSLGLRAASAGAFPRGPVELAWHAMRRGNEAMSRAMQADAADAALDWPRLPANERLFRGLRARLRHTAPLARSWPQAMALGARPQALPETLRLLAVMADECWFLAGDRSASLHWYSRRAVLVGVFVAAEAHMLTDRSAGLEDTWAFLRRRIEDATELGRAADGSASAAAAACAGVGAIAESAAELLVPARARAACASMRAAADADEAREPGTDNGSGGGSGSAAPRARAAVDGAAGFASAAASAVGSVDAFARAAARSAGVTLPELDLQALLGAVGSMLPAAGPAAAGGERSARAPRNVL